MPKCVQRCNNLRQALIDNNKKISLCDSDFLYFSEENDECGTTKFGRKVSLYMQFRTPKPNFVCFY